MKFTNDFTTIRDAIYVDIAMEIEASLNAKPITICKCSNHPEDDYLYLYIALAPHGYITGLANTSRKGSVGLYENHYGLSFKSALEILANKIHDCNNTAK